MKRITPIFWAIVFLAAFDVTTNMLTRYPAEPSDESETGAFQRYFNYGLSVESKVRWMTADSDERAAPLVQAGWLTPNDERRTQTAPEGKRLIAFYGMSFSNRVAMELERIDERFALRLNGGPAATVARSYMDYLLDREKHDASIVMLGVLASSVPVADTVTHMTWNFEAPSPHFYPKFSVDGEGLSRIDPPIASLEEFRAALADQVAWRELVDFIEEHDTFYDRASFRADALDRSVIGRLLRRAWAHLAHRRHLARFYDGSGFTDYQQSITTTLTIIEAFADQARRDGQVPIVLLFNDRGFSDHLYQAMHGRLDELNVPYLSSHEVADPDDPAYFVQDGHFRAGVDEEIAVQLADLIDRLSITTR